MKRLKYSIVFFLLVLMIPGVCFCQEIASSSECVLMFFPRNIVNNSAIGIDLEDANGLETSDFSSPLTFSSSSKDNLSLFRLHDTLMNDYQYVVSYSDFSSYSSDANAATGNSTKVRILTTGLFVNEEDPTIVRDFELDVFFTRAEINSTGSAYSLKSGYPIKMSLGTTYSLEGSATTYFKRTDGSNYELYVPSSPLVSFRERSGGSYFNPTYTYRIYPRYMRLYDICVVLKDDSEYLEPGYYTTTITIVSEEYSNARFTEFDESWWYHPTTMQISETITIRGYIGDEPEGSACDLIVSAAKDTYSMDLGLDAYEGADKYYDIANLSMYSFNASTSEPNSLERAEKYKVYISPGSSYTANYSATDGNPPYYFYKKGTENATRTPSNTIYFDLYVNDGSFKNLNDTTNSYTTSTEFGGAERYSPYVYCIKPYYSYVSHTYSSSSNNTYYETWKLNTDIYLKLTEETMSFANNHSPGEYLAYIYVTLVTT